jgi:hypothetical protein
MADLQSGEVFIAGQVLTHTQLNNAINAAVIQAAFLTGKTAITPVGGDYVLFYDVSGTVLGKCTMTALITALIGLTGTTAAAGNDSRFSSSVTGIRKGAGNGSTDTAAVPKDYVLAPTHASLSAGVATLNCALNNVFYIALDANGTITLSGIADGDEIEIRVAQDATGSRTLTWSTLQTITYEGGVAPTPTAAANGVDYWKFRRFGNELRCSILQDVK